MTYPGGTATDLPSFRIIKRVQNEVPGDVVNIPHREADHRVTGILSSAITTMSPTSSATITITTQVGGTKSGETRMLLESRE
ncbi:hypothetical protein MC885_014309 [Smutsia gigantea]|nr:hypothetical protein MC885_014309 [Smutsia gigantea]